MKIAVKIFAGIFLMQLSFLAIAEKSVTGVIRDEHGHVVEGVTVQIKGTDLATISDENGEYALKVPDNAVLLYSLIGLKTIEKEVDDEKMNVTLKDATQDLIELIVVTPAY